jgi:hypothetical protein
MQIVKEGFYLCIRMGRSVVADRGHNWGTEMLNENLDLLLCAGDGLYTLRADGGFV